MTATASLWLVGKATVVPVLEKILEGGGYAVTVKDSAVLTAPSPGEGPDLIILAEEPPRLSQLLASLKAQPYYREVPVIAALTRFSDAVAAQTLGQGAEEFLTPPFQAQEVLARVMVVLRLQQQRRLLLASQAEFARLFTDSPQPLFYSDAKAHRGRLNPAFQRLLGYSGQGGEEPPEDFMALLYDGEDRERFRRLLNHPPGAPVKLRFRNRTGQAVTVLVGEQEPPPPSPQHRAFEIQPVGTPSTLKRAIQNLVDNLLPGAREYLNLIHLTPLLGGRYDKVKKLGQGSYGEVWLVRDTETPEDSRQYVAKIPVSPKANAKFRKEAEICRRLSPHPGVVQPVETLEDDGKVVLIQEYVPGQTLEDMLSEELPQPLAERLVIQLIDVVAHAHRHRIMHRDIKPGNIIVTPEGTLKLLDFGAGKILKEKDISATMVGSRPFMAPEQIMGESERRSDIWAIGVIMYLLYTGELPFYSEVEKILIDQILEQAPTPPRELQPELPAALEAIMLKCLAKEVDRRYASAGDLKADLLRHFPHYGQQAA